jgi:hypothetical protein
MFIRYDIELLPRVAEATLKDFRDRLGRAMTQQAISDGALRALGHEGGVQADAP